MFNPKSLLNQRILYVKKKTFFLKYFENKGLLNKVNNNNNNNAKIKKENLKESSLNLKELLDEKNVKLSFSDIRRDYKYFSFEYYNYDYTEFYSRYGVTEDTKETLNQSNIPFEKKDMNYQNIKSYLVKNKNSYYTKMFLLAIAMNIIGFYFQYKQKSVSENNLKAIESVDKNLKREQTQNSK